MKHAKVVLVAVAVVLAVLLAVMAYDAQAAGDPVPVLYVGCDGYTWSGSPNVMNLMDCTKLRIGSECVIVTPLGAFTDPETGAVGFQVEVMGWEGACQ